MRNSCPSEQWWAPQLSFQNGVLHGSPGTPKIEVELGERDNESQLFEMGHVAAGSRPRWCSEKHDGSGTGSIFVAIRFFGVANTSGETRSDHRATQGKSAGSDR